MPKKPKRAIKKPTKPTPTPKSTPASTVPAAVAAAIQAESAPQASPDKLDALRHGAEQCRDIMLDIASHENATTELRAKLRKLQEETLVELMNAAHVKELTLSAQGNSPAVVFEMKPFYHASIPKDETKAGEAFAWLRKHNHGDIIKNVFTVPMGMGDDKAAKKLTAALKKLKLEYSRKVSVPAQTLAAFVREQIEQYQKTPPLDLLGAYVGNIVKPKEERKRR